MQTISEVKPAHLDDVTEKYSQPRIKTLNYASYTKTLGVVVQRAWLNLDNSSMIQCQKPKYQKL